MEVGYSGAVPFDEPELAEARRLGLMLHHRADLLAEIVAQGEGIAVAGSHGKTTTSGMIAFVLAEVGADPTFVVGGSLPQLGVNARSGSGRHVVVEADESDGSLVRLRPRIAVCSTSRTTITIATRRGASCSSCSTAGRARSLPARGSSPATASSSPAPGSGASARDRGRAGAHRRDERRPRSPLHAPPPGAADLAVSLASPACTTRSTPRPRSPPSTSQGSRPSRPRRCSPASQGQVAVSRPSASRVVCASSTTTAITRTRSPRPCASRASRSTPAGGVIACLLPHQPFRVRHLKRELGGRDDAGRSRLRARRLGCPRTARGGDRRQARGRRDLAASTPAIRLPGRRASTMPRSGSSGARGRAT